MFSEIQKEKKRFNSIREISSENDTLPKCLRKNYLMKPERIAMRVKDMGIWQSYTWKDCYEKVKFFSLGLVSLSLAREDKVSILGENKPEWYWAELGIQAAGGIAVGIFTDCIPSEVKFYVEHSESKFVIAHDQEQVDKILEIKDHLPLLKKVIYWDPKGLWSYRDPILMSFEEVLELGQAYEKNHPGFLEEKLDQGKAEDIATICYTSGTTGVPKGAMISHLMLVKGQRETSILQGWFGKEGYNYVSIAPAAWFSEQMTGIAGWVATNQVINFPEEPETVQIDLREIAPEILLYGARQWEALNRLVQAKMEDTTFFRRLIYNTFLQVGLKVANLRYERRKVNILWRSLYFIAYQAIFRQLRDRLGLGKVKVVMTGGAAMSPEIIRYYKALGLDVALFYGTTEVGLVTCPESGKIRPETSGRPTPWCDVKLSNEGEILIRTNLMYSGYYRNQEATQKKIKDGWYCTGDYGYIDEEGYLSVIDRMDDMKPLAGGKKFSPQYAEARLRFSPFIKDVLVVGGEIRTYVSAVVNIDIENVGRYAEAHQIPYTTYTDLSQKPEVIDIVKRTIEKINRTLPDHARIKKFVNLHKEFDADEQELTRTRKLRRTYVEEQYTDLISALYSDFNELKVETPVTYRDGRKGVITTAIKINRIEL
jgi:long-chain acyl-CoA synthetase